MGYTLVSTLLKWWKTHWGNPTQMIYKCWVSALHLCKRLLNQPARKMLWHMMGYHSLIFWRGPKSHWNPSYHPHGYPATPTQWPCSEIAVCSIHGGQNLRLSITSIHVWWDPSESHKNGANDKMIQNDSKNSHKNGDEVWWNMMKYRIKIADIRPTNISGASPCHVPSKQVGLGGYARNNTIYWYRYIYIYR